MTDIESILRDIVREELRPIRAALAEIARNVDSAPVVMQAPPESLPDGYMTQDQAAEYLGISPSTLATWRSHRNTGRAPRRGPDYVTMGRIIRYKRSVVEAYANEQQ